MIKNKIKLELVKGLTFMTIDLKGVKKNNQDIFKNQMYSMLNGEVYCPTLKQESMLYPIKDILKLQTLLNDSDSVYMYEESNKLFINLSPKSEQVVKLSGTLFSKTIQKLLEDVEDVTTLQNHINEVLNYHAMYWCLNSEFYMIKDTNDLLEDMKKYNASIDVVLKKLLDDLDVDVITVLKVMEYIEQEFHNIYLMYDIVDNATIISDYLTSNDELVIDVLGEMKSLQDLLLSLNKTINVSKSATYLLTPVFKVLSELANEGVIEFQHDESLPLLENTIGEYHEIVHPRYENSTFALDETEHEMIQEYFDYNIVCEKLRNEDIVLCIFSNIQELDLS